MRTPASPGQVLAIVCAGIVLANLDLFIVNVALPDIARDFGDANLGDLSWILNGYAIIYAALLVLCGRLAERYPRNLSFLAGIALFTVASAACALADSVESLVAFRLLQAAGAALLTPTSLGLILATFPAERRGGAVRTWAAIGGFAAALGPWWVGCSSRSAGAGSSWSTSRSASSRSSWVRSGSRAFQATMSRCRATGRPR
jgi:MFS family permease